MTLAPASAFANAAPPAPPVEYTTEARRWEAVRRRDRRAAGAFLYGVRTTRIYCRPGCSSRLPNPANVVYFAAAAEAECAGYRACRKCRPDQAAAASPASHLPQPVLRACRTIEATVAAGEEPPTLARLAAAVGLGAHRLHRLFRRAVGLSPKAYASAVRERRLRDALPKSRSVADAIYGAGFGSGSRVYERTRGMLGMTPAQVRRGAPGARIRFAVARSYLGWVVVAETDRGVCAIEIGDDPGLLRRRLSERFPKADLQEGDRMFAARVAEVIAFIEAPERGLALPLDVQGTAFQKRVWKALQSVPPGATTTYAALARRIGRPGAARAVARACASNRLALAVPCHRAVRADGGLGGYRWGVERKRRILAREAAKRAPRSHSSPCPPRGSGRWSSGARPICEPSAPGE
jgi:AraC family transcriptional regulator of adaptative response/methylated-DNA-[protein]-cysteine methyltransferase